MPSLAKQMELVLVTFVESSSNTSSPGRTLLLRIDRMQLTHGTVTKEEVEEAGVGRDQHIPNKFTFIHSVCRH